MEKKAQNNKLYSIEEIREGRVEVSEKISASTPLGSEILDFLKKTYWKEITREEWEEVGKLLELAKDHSFPTRKSEFLEGVHYYLENGNWVFTRLYHTLRGHCCNSGCRHCAYGYGKS